jgi:hypothetical protein
MRSAHIFNWIGLAALVFLPVSTASAGHTGHGGGGGGGSHASSGGNGGHTSGGGHATGRSSGGGGSHADAESRHPGGGSGEGEHERHGRFGGVFIGGGGFWPYCWDCGYSYYDPAYYGGYYPRYHYYYDNSAAVRVMVEPNKARVYVDGYYAGIVDDFDGLFQRLYIPSGRHEIMLKLEGYKTHRFLLYGVPGHTTKLHYNMVQGAGEDAPDNLAGPDGVPPVAPPDGPNAQPAPDGPDVTMNDRPRDRVVVDRRDSGTLSLDVRPRDASVYIDGQGEPDAARDDVTLAAGVHKVEVVRPGYKAFAKDVEIRPGKTTEIDVRLEKD